MRSKFPVFWLVQFLALSCLSAINFFYPIGVLEFYSGQLAPERVAMPEDALYTWVLGLDAIQPPSETVRSFFRDYNEEAYVDQKIWTPKNPSLAKVRRASGAAKQPSAETVNEAWAAAVTWILSGEPAPPATDREAIKSWLDAVDATPVPSRKLRQWIVAQDTPQAPPTELRLMILKARQTLPVSWDLASDQVRLTAPCIMAAALFTLLGLLTPSIRRPLARVFVLAALFWTVARLQSSLGPPEWNLFHGVVIGGMIFGLAMVATAVRATPRLTTGATLFFVIAAWWTAIVFVAALAEYDDANVWARSNVVLANAFVAVVGIANAYYWLVGESEDPQQDNAGIAQRRPPQLWTIWFLQFAMLIANGLVAVLFPGWVADLFIHSHVEYLAIDIVDDAVRMLGSWVVAMSLFSYFALGVGQDWIWQGISVIFCGVFLLASSTIIFASSDEYGFWAYAYGLQGLVFVPVTVYLLLRKDPWATENVERARTDDWSLTDLSVGPILMWKALAFGRRAVYRYGVGARGHLRVLPDTTSAAGEVNRRPASQFFVPGRHFSVQMRFANRTQKDDAALDIRGCALRLSNGPKSPLDLMFATGAFAPMSALVDFRQSLPHRNVKRYINRRKVVREGLAAGVRRAPASFAALTYYHQIVLEWLTPNAEPYLVRFRLVPAPSVDAHQDAERASLLGLPGDEDLQQLWVQKRRHDETRSPDYLRQEFHDRLKGGRPVVFQLEVQTHRQEYRHSVDWYDPALEWDARACPWHPLAEIVLDQPMTASECEGFCADPSTLPSCLNVPKPEDLASFHDPRALAAARHRIVRVLGRLRTWRRPPPASLYADRESVKPTNGTESVSIDRSYKLQTESSDDDVL